MPTQRLLGYGATSLHEGFHLCAIQRHEASVTEIEYRGERRSEAKIFSAGLLYVPVDDTLSELPVNKR